MAGTYPGYSYEAKTLKFDIPGRDDIWNGQDGNDVNSQLVAHQGILISLQSGTGTNYTDSIVNTGGTVTLLNDQSSPGNSYYYGTNSSGAKGYFNLPNSMVYPPVGIAVSTGTSWQATTGTLDPSGNAILSTLTANGSTLWGNVVVGDNLTLLEDCPANLVVNSNTSYPWSIVIERTDCPASGIFLWNNAGQQPGLGGQFVVSIENGNNYYQNPLVVNVAGIGINQFSPLYALDIYDNLNTGKDAGNSHTGLWSISNTGNILANSFSTNGGTQSHFLKADGSTTVLSAGTGINYDSNTGIISSNGGTVTYIKETSPNSTLTISALPITASGTITADINLGNPNSWTGTQSFLNVYASGTLTTLYNTLDNGSGGGHFAGGLTTQYNTLDDGISGSAFFNKNVGIGTASPAAPLNVVTNLANQGLYFDAFASNPNPAVVFRSGEGTSGSPSALLNNDGMGSFAGRGYGTTSMGSNSKVSMAFFASQNWTDSAQGTYIAFATTPVNTTSRSEVMRITNAGGVGIGITSPPAAGLQVSGNTILNASGIFQDISTLDITASGSVQLITATANTPLYVGSGKDVTSGTFSGNTKVFGTTSGALPSGNLASFDANGNIIDSTIVSGTLAPSGVAFLDGNQTFTGTNIFNPAGYTTFSNSVSFVPGTGGNITSYVSAGITYKVHSFLSSGTFVAPNQNTVCTVLAVGGGGSGAGGYAYSGGCGGAGGLIYQTYSTTANQNIGVTIGAGGVNGGYGGGGGPGNNTVFGTLTALYGAAGAYSGSGLSGGSGGSPGYGGGSGGAALQPTSASGGYGNAGSSSTNGGGGGAGGAGSGSSAGPGLTFSITGSPVTYATGGQNGSGTGGNNTGNGGGIGGGNGYNGGSGIVVVSYAIPGLTQSLYTTGGVGINTITNPALLSIASVGSTSSTESISVVNSSSSTILKLTDDGALTTGSLVTSGSITGNSINVSASGVFQDISTLDITASGSLQLITATANTPLYVGSGKDITSGAFSGNTKTFGTTSGALASGHIAAFDVNGNIVDGLVASGNMALLSNNQTFTGVNTFLGNLLVGTQSTSLSGTGNIEASGSIKSDTQILSPSGNFSNIMIAASGNLTGLTANGVVSTYNGNGSLGVTPSNAVGGMTLFANVDLTVYYTFTVTSANATAGATYTNNGQTFTVVTTISGSVTLITTGTGAPAASGTLTKSTGSGDSTIAFSSKTQGVSSVTINSLTGTRYLFVVNGWNTNSAQLGIQFNGDSGSNYTYAQTFAYSAGVTSNCTASQTLAPISVGVGANNNLQNVFTLITLSGNGAITSSISYEGSTGASVTAGTSQTGAQYFGSTPVASLTYLARSGLVSGNITLYQLN